MSTVFFNAAPDYTSASTAYNFLHRISAALKTFGWVQKGDTGQVTWPGSILSITQATTGGGGTTETFTYTVLQGPALQSGSSVTVTNCTTAGLNTTYIVQSLGAGTFTVNSTTNVTEAETAFGGVNPQASITAALGNGSTNTYTYTVFDGAADNFPRVGQTIVVTNCTTSGFNGTFTVGSLGVGTFTTTAGGISHASEVETAQGIVTANSVSSTRTSSTIPPTVNNFLFEIWGMNDVAQSTLPVFIKVAYQTSGTSGPQIIVTICTSTDGAGTPTGQSTALTSVQGTTTGSTSALNSYLSGSTNRLSWLLCAGGASANFKEYLSIERSHDANGNDTTTYASGLGFQFVSGGVGLVVVSFTTTQTSVTETKFPVLVNHTTGTSNFGSTILLCPVFPIVGAIGNPCINTMVGKSSDWSDGAQFPFTIYGSSHNYIISNLTLFSATAGNITYDATPTCAIAMRYD
jgi:hypothetical protein